MLWWINAGLIVFVSLVGLKFGVLANADIEIEQDTEATCKPSSF